MLPVLDFRNKAIPFDNINSFDVNKSIQRATVKALALHGLGLNIYAGEDLPVVDISFLRRKAGELLQQRVEKGLNTIAVPKSLKKHLGVTELKYANDIKSLEAYIIYLEEKLKEGEKGNGTTD